jgi:hypothetical protein
MQSLDVRHHRHLRPRDPFYRDPKAALAYQLKQTRAHHVSK